MKVLLIQKLNRIPTDSCAGILLRLRDDLDHMYSWHGGKGKPSGGVSVRKCPQGQDLMAAPDVLVCM